CMEQLGEERSKELWRLAGTKDFAGASNLFHVLRHRLLRQTLGFEGFVTAGVQLHADRLAVPYGPHVGEPLVQMHAAPARRTVRARHDNDPVSGIDVLLRLDPEVLIHLEDAPHRTGPRLWRPARAWLHDGSQLHPLEIRR